MGFWGEFLSSFTFGLYTPKDRRVNKFSAAEHVSHVYCEGCLKIGMSKEQVKTIMLPALPYKPESNENQLVYFYVNVVSSGNRLTRYDCKLTLRFYDDKLLPDENGFIL